MSFHPLRLLWAGWMWLLLAIMVLAAAVAVLLLPSLPARRRAARAIGRSYFWLAGMPLHYQGLERLPPGPCIVVANHSSYLDGPLLFAALPPRFALVIKKEASRIPVAGRLLTRMGHQFVERFDRHEGANDARRILRAVAAGESVAFFPEGTFSDRDGLARFHAGAFATAVRAGVPVAPVVIRGTRRALRSGTWMPRRTRLEVVALDPLPPAPGDDAAARLRDLARERMGTVLGEGLL
ncbi:MAG: 1-acyl-sn-glycerol-3-phosphate acyltransferase [Gammaproteobacteria bacterium]|nr:MAG: 1-acyl-sn-glycerol-3-phosphate acyltransferase [Gammaproteobacteria bacterium]